MDTFGGIAFFCGSVTVIYTLAIWFTEWVIDRFKDLAGAV